jgi:predicted MFS family arabinose efflux permease
MFGTIIFLPFYMQAVMGLTPTQSGLGLLPMVIGLFSTSISSGRLISRTGRYKIYPIIGAAVLTFALLLLSRLRIDTPYWQLAIYMLAFGAGLGLTMQTIVTAVQNSVAMRDLGTATSATTFFRQMGGTIGAAVFGAILSNRLGLHLTEQVGQAAAAAQGNATNNIQTMQALPEPIKSIVLGAFTRALDDVFLAGLPVVLIALAVSLLIPEVPLRSRERQPAGEPAAASEALSVGV